VVPLVKINLRPCTPGCDADPAKIACDYQKYDLDKIVSTKFAESGSPAYTLVKNFQWTNAVARSIAVDGLSDDETAKKFIDAHPELVAKWLAGTGAGNAGVIGAGCDPAIPRSDQGGAARRWYMRARQIAASHSLDMPVNWRQTVAHCEACFAVRYKYPIYPVTG
jgi:hypothetical protein